MLKFNIFNASNALINKDGTPTREFYAFCRAVWNSLGGGQAIDVPQQVEANKIKIDTKQDKLNTAQLAAVNSGIDAQLTAQISTNKNDIVDIGQTISGYGNIVTHNVAEFVAYPANIPAKINTPTGGTVIDDQARTAINSIIAILEQYGLTLNN